MALAAGENASLFMQAIAVMIADGTNKGRLADPWQRRVPDDRDALLLLAIVQQNSGPLCRELATRPGRTSHPFILPSLGRGAAPRQARSFLRQTAIGQKTNRASRQ
jgi:hypothetical protein